MKKLTEKQRDWIIKWIDNQSSDIRCSSMGHTTPMVSSISLKKFLTAHTEPEDEQCPHCAKYERNCLGEYKPNTAEDDNQIALRKHKKWLGWITQKGNNPFLSFGDWLQEEQRLNERKN